MDEIKLSVGALAPSVSEQLIKFGIAFDTDGKYQQSLDAVTRLLLQGYLPHSQANKARDKIIKDVFKQLRKRVVSNGRS